MPNILQDARKRDDKSRTFAPPDNTDEEKKSLKELTRLKYPDDLIELNLNKKPFGKIKRPTELEVEKFLENINKYKDINLNDFNNLIDDVLDLGDNKYVYFNDINDFLHDIKDGNINNFDREKKYKETSEDIENKLANRKKYGKYIDLYVKYFNNLRKILFTKKSSGRGLTISSLPILLSKIYTNNSSKELINNIEQLINNLYGNKQITKQVYNNLNKAITYKNDS